MRQRVSMARTLASEPKILLMDEPFAALDEQTRLLLGDKVLQIQQELKQTTLLDHPQPDRSGAALRPHPGDDLPAGQDQAHRRDQAAAPAHLGDRQQRRLRPLCRANLERSARGGEPRVSRTTRRACARRRTSSRERAARHPAAGRARSCSGSPACSRWSPLIEVLIRVGLINRLHRAEAVRRS